MCHVSACSLQVITLNSFVLLMNVWIECWLQAVLRRRDAIQMEYDMVVDELNKRKDEKEHVSKEIRH